MEQLIRLQPPITVPDDLLKKRIKRAFIIVVAVFTLHAVPRGAMREFFPIVRWSMFAGIGVYELEPSVTYGLTIHTADGQTHEILYSSVAHSSTGQLYASSGIADHDLQAWRIINRAMTDESDALRTEYKAVLFDRITKYYETEITKVEIYRTVYDVEIDQFPFVDFNSPSEATALIDELTAQSVAVAVDAAQ